MFFIENEQNMDIDGYIIDKKVFSSYQNLKHHFTLIYLVN